MTQKQQQNNKGLSRKQRIERWDRAIDFLPLKMHKCEHAAELLLV